MSPPEEVKIYRILVKIHNVDAYESDSTLINIMDKDRGSCFCIILRHLGTTFFTTAAAAASNIVGSV